MTPQKTYGDFTKERFGPNWVFAARKLPKRFARNGEEQTVITPKEQRQLAANYKAEWGREYDAKFWQMLCALRSNRLMMYAWKAARASLGLPDDHGELNAAIAEMESAIKAATS